MVEGHGCAAIGRPRLPAYFRLAAARWDARRNDQSAGQAPTQVAVAALYRQALRRSLADPLDLHDLVIDGDDLRAAGIPPGPDMGRTLAALLQLVLDDPTMNAREKLLDAATRMKR